jgi:hypothetical protein
MGLPKIPHHYRRKGYQRFFGGLIIGFIGGWMSFLLSFGGLQEDYITKIKQLQLEKDELKDQNQALLEDPVRLNEENIKNLIIEEVVVYFDKESHDEIDKLPLHNLENVIKADLEIVLQKDVESVATNTKLIRQLLENRIFKIDDESYQVKVSELHLYTKLVLYLTVKQIK